MTIDLTSSGSDDSGSSHPGASLFPLIPVPIPSYGDCFQVPRPDSDIFDPIEYQASVRDLMLEDEDDVESEDESVEFPSRLGGRCDHLDTVKFRLEVEVTLVAASPWCKTADVSRMP